MVTVQTTAPTWYTHNMTVYNNLSTLCTLHTRWHGAHISLSSESQPMGNRKRAQSRRTSLHSSTCTALLRSQTQNCGTICRLHKPSHKWLRPKSCGLDREHLHSANVNPSATLLITAPIQCQSIFLLLQADLPLCLFQTARSLWLCHSVHLTLSSFLSTFLIIALSESISLFQLSVYITC